jgi:hypothetical protein
LNQIPTDLGIPSDSIFNEQALKKLWT